MKVKLVLVPVIDAGNFHVYMDIIQCESLIVLS